jgi:hypothetical protein
MIEILVLKPGKVCVDAGWSSAAVCDSKDPDLKLGEDGSEMRGNERYRSLKPFHDLKTSGRGRDGAPEDPSGVFLGSLQEAEDVGRDRRCAGTRSKDLSQLRVFLFALVVLSCSVETCRGICPNSNWLYKHFCAKCDTDRKLYDFVEARRTHYPNGSKVADGVSPNDFSVSHVLTNPASHEGDGLPEFIRLWSFQFEIGRLPTAICRNIIPAPAGSATKVYRKLRGERSYGFKILWHGAACHAYHDEYTGHNFDVHCPAMGEAIHVGVHRMVWSNETDFFDDQGEGDHLYNQSSEEEEEGNNSSRRIDDEL